MEDPEPRLLVLSFSWKMVGVMNSGLRTHLHTEVVSIPIHAGCQPLQRAQEVPNLFPGWALAVHNLEGL